MAEKTRKGTPILAFANQYQRLAPLICAAARWDVPLPVAARGRSSTCVFFVCHERSNHHPGWTGYTQWQRLDTSLDRLFHTDLRPDSNVEGCLFHMIRDSLGAVTAVTIPCLVAGGRQQCTLQS